MNPRLRTSLIVLVLFLATWAPRVLALDVFVTADERKWLGRSANFYNALAHGDLPNTFQREHPGVTVMWAGTLGLLQQFPSYPQVTPGYFNWNVEDFEAWLKANTTLTPLQLLVAGRWWIVLGISIIQTAAFFPLRRLLGETLAAIAVLFLAWMPWSVALSRQLHPDGLVSSLTFVAFAFFLGWLYGGRQKVDLIVSGILMGLAWLTKTPAAFLVPIGAILIGIEIARGARGEGRGANRQLSIVNCQLSMKSVRANIDSQPTSSPWRPLIAGYIVWGVIATATFVLLWPSMWVNPFGTLARMAGEMEGYVGGHVNANYFLGQAVADPGPFFYPVAWLFRITPATVIGLAAATVAALWRRSPFDRPLVRRTALAMLDLCAGIHCPDDHPG